MNYNKFKHHLKSEILLGIVKQSGKKRILLTMDLIDLVEKKHTNFNSNESRLSCYIVKISLNIIEKRSNTIIYVFSSPYEHDILIIGQKSLRKYCSQ